MTLTSIITSQTQTHTFNYNTHTQHPTAKQNRQHNKYNTNNTHTIQKPIQNNYKHTTHISIIIYIHIYHKTQMNYRQT